MYINFLFAILVTEAITELLTKSEFFSPLREWFFDRKDKKICDFIHRLLDCGYCTSVWIGFFVSISVIKIHIVNIYIDWFIVWLVVHRCSNVLHFIIDRTRGLDKV